MRTCRLTLVLCALGAFAGTAPAQLPHARLDRIFPLGGQAGSTVLLTLTGKDLDDVKALHFDHAGLKAAFVKAGQFRVAVGADVPAGTHEVRTVGRHGISGSRLFAVDRGLTEVMEKEPNDTAATAQKVAMNVAINGTSDGDGDDFFRFPARKGERIVLDCQALRLDSTLRATLVLSTPAGKELARSKPYYGRTDPLLDFVAPEAGDYLVQLHDTTFQGGLPYRLVISNLPHVENVFPAAIAPGQTVQFTVLGRNLPGAKPTAGGTIDRPLEQIAVPFTAPADVLSLQRFAFRQHPATPSLTARGLQAWPKGLEKALNPITLALAPAPVTLEREPNDTAATAQEVKLPTTVCGRLDRPGDVDWYSFTAKAGEQIGVDLLCERLDFPGDLFVLVTDAKGREVAQFDDHGINFNALAQFNRDPFGAFTAPTTGKYHLLVQDRYRNGGPRYQYVLTLERPRPDFFPVAFHETNPDPTCPLVRRGGSAHLEVCLNRRHFRGPVVIEAEGLPPGVACPPVHVSAQTEFASVVFTATPDAAEWAGAIRLKAWATIDGKRVEREVRCAQRRWAIANVNASRVCREICLAVRGPAPYGLLLPSDKVTTATGSSFKVRATVRRQWPDFKGPVRLTGLNLPPGFSMATVEMPADKGSLEVEVKVGGVPPGSYTLVLRGDAQVPFARTEKGPKTMVRVADPSTPLTVVVAKK